MWAPRYYAERYFAGRYWANGTLDSGPPETGDFVQVISSRPPRAPFPDAPQQWSQSSKSAWMHLIRALETSPTFTTSYRTRPTFLVASTVSAPVTLDMNSPDITVLSQVLAKLLVALSPSPYIKVR